MEIFKASWLVYRASTVALLLVAVAILLMPTTASAVTSSQAQKAAEDALQQEYGAAWLERAPSWSVPECEQPQVPGDYQCMAEFEYVGTWHFADVLVEDDTATIAYQKEWARGWRPNSNHCDKPIVVAGYLSSNHPGCDALLLYQNFGLAPGHRKTVRYTGFKKHLYFYGTGTGLWPDFFGYTCQRSHGYYECANKFGDGFRWKPSPPRKKS